jgi:predicted regulator of Ras-like GTPase activity (Roadblock/LC7/MglB family)
MADTRHLLAQVLDRIVREPGVEGAEVLSVDGQCLLEAFRPDLDVATFSRLSATLAAAGESALPVLRGARTRQIVTQTDRLKVVVVRANDGLLLAALARREGSEDRLVQVLEAAAADLDRSGRRSAA